MKVTLLALGEAMVDVVASAPATPGAPTHAPIRLQAGGTPVNAALAAASLGASAAVVARVGDDPAAASIRHALAAKGVHAVLAVDSDQPTGVFVQAAGGTVANRGANDHLDAADFGDWPEHEALLVSGYTFRAATEAAAQHALRESAARWRAVDAGGAPSGAELSRANVLFGTWDELRQNDADAPEAVALRLADRFEAVVLKLGGEGAVVAAAGSAHRVRPPAREPEGAVGAGDALDAGFLVGLARGLQPSEALELGVSAATAHIRDRRVTTSG